MGNGRGRDGMGRQLGWGEQEYLLNTIIAMDFIFRSKCIRIVCRPCSARTSKGSLNTPSEPIDPQVQLVARVQ